MGGIISTGKYEHHPLVGDRPMKYPYTMSAKIAQFPWVYYWRYSVFMKPFCYGLIPIFYFNHLMDQVVNTPENIEYWRNKRNEWYSRKPDPEEDYF